MGAAYAEGEFAPAPGADSTETAVDNSPNSPASIRKNYFKRFPYAKEANSKDSVSDKESRDGTTESYQAYSQVLKKCDGQDMDPQYKCDMLGPNCKSVPPVLTPHIFYKQDTQTATVQLPTMRDSEAVKSNLIQTYGLPVSDTQFQLIDRANKQRLLEMAFDPERWMWSELASGQMQSEATANALGGAAQTSFNQAYTEIGKDLINVANEKAAQGSSGSGIESAVRIVQQAYKQIFMPMALLLLLPGVTLTQLKGLTGYTFLGSDDEDGRSPFDGLIRAVIAIFLIPATQLIVSYCIDIGNQLTDEVRNPSAGWIQKDVLQKWSGEQTFVPQLTNNALPLEGSPGSGAAGTGGAGGSSGAVGGGSAGGNAGSGSGGQGQSGGAFNLNIFGGSDLGQFGNQFINNFLNGMFGPGADFAGRVLSVLGGEGKQAGQSEDSSHQEDQGFLSTSLQLGFNGASYLMGYALTFLTAYQLVFMCYLFLLGPIAACFFAWPSGFGKLFKKVFVNWLDAVVVLSLWRFYWCVILACMTQRIIYLQQTGGYNPNSPLEMVVYNCFMALLLYVPFQPFNFNPGEAAAGVLDKAGGGAGGAGGAGAGGAGGAMGAGQPGPAGHQSMSAQRHGFATSEFRAISTGGGEALSGSGSDGDTGQHDHGLVPLPRHEGGGSHAHAPQARGELASPPAVSAASAPGHSADGAQEPPPSEATRQAALSKELRNELGSSQIESLPAGAPPAVPLSPAGGASSSAGKFILNTSDPKQARQGMQSWQQSSVMPGASSAVATTGGANIQSGGQAALPPSTSAGKPASAQAAVDAAAGGNAPPGAKSDGQTGAGQTPPQTSPLDGQKPPDSGKGTLPPSSENKQ